MTTPRSTSAGMVGVVALGVLAVLLAVVLVRRADGQPGPAPVDPAAARAPAAVSAARTTRAGGRGPAPDATPATSARWHEAALRLLHQWDARRAEAYAQRSRGALSELYLPGSAAGVADERLLRRYRQRGLRVAAIRTQVLAVAVVERRPDRWVLRVTDRVADAVVLRGRVRVRVPRDQPSTRLLTLVRATDGRWRMSSVAEGEAGAGAGAGGATARPPAAATPASGGRR